MRGLFEERPVAETPVSFARRWADFAFRSRVVGEGAPARGQFSRLTEQLPGLAFWRFERATNTLSLSPRCIEIFGQFPDRPISPSRVLRRFHRKERRAVIETLVGIFKHGAPIRNQLHRIVPPTGDARTVLGNCEVYHDGATSCAVLQGTLVDVTDLVATRRALIQSEARYRDLAEATRELFVEIDMKGRILFVSAAVKAILGYGEDALRETKAASLMHLDDLPGMVAGIAGQLQSPQELPPLLEARVRHADGRWIWLEGRPFVDLRQGRIHGVVRDVTDRKIAQAKLEAERARTQAALEARSVFLANMSHELRTPLTAVLGYAALMDGLDDLPEHVRDYVGRIATAGKALSSVIEDVLKLSKLENGEVEPRLAPCAIAPLIDDTVKMFALHAAEKGLEFRVQVLETPPRVLMLDPDRVRQVLINLIANAIRFTDAGSVTVEVTWRAEVEELFLAVDDTGIGIDQDALARLFKRFSQLNTSRIQSRGGSGLGLAISKGLVDAMKGEISVSSRPGEGSRFWFRLPAKLPLVGQDEGETSAPAFEPVRTGARILLADDNALNRELSRTILGVFDVDLTEARDGREAVSRAMTQAFDIILMDIRMPDMDGIQATRAIRAGAGPNQDTPILAFTADIDFDPGDLFDGSLRKPITAAHLIEAVANAAERRASAPAASHLPG
mgnify:CR=1 FL=1